MMKRRVIIFVAALVVPLILFSQFAYCESDNSVPAAPVGFDEIYKSAPIKEGVKIITYEQLAQIRRSGEKVFLVDVLSGDDYRTGHIEGAISLPASSINKATVENRIPKGSKVVVYCLSDQCHLSVEAAYKLSSYGYKVLDYVGGLDEWQEKGNALAR